MKSSSAFSTIVSAKTMQADKTEHKILPINMHIFSLHPFSPCSFPQIKQQN